MEQYDEILASCVPLPGGQHSAPPALSGRVFTVTTIARSPESGGERTPVVCESFDRARQIVETNEGDIWEYSYMLAVIEGVRLDYLYGSDEQPQFWYRWEGGEEGHYVPIETPPRLKNVVGWGIG